MSKKRLIIKFKKFKAYIYETFSGTHEKRKTLANAKWLISEKVFYMVFGVVVTAILARYFGTKTYGQFNYALAFTSLFSTLSVMGLETLTIKALVEKEHEEGEILITTFIIRIFGGILLTLIAVTLIMLIEPKDTEIHIMVLILSMMMVFKSLEVIEYWIQANQRSKILSIIKMVIFVVFSLSKLVLVLFNGSVVTYTIMYAIDSIIIGFSLVLIFNKYRQKPSFFKFNFTLAKKLLSESWYLILAGLLITIYTRTDQVMLGAMMPDRSEVGIYSAASRIAEMWYFIPLAIIISFKPVILAYKKNDENNFKKSINGLYTIVLWIGIIFGLLFTFLSDFIVLLLYGKEFSGASAILSISIWAGVFITLGNVRSLWLIAENKSRYSLFYVFVGSLVNVSLNLLLIPKYGGIGAAFASLCSQLVVNLIAPLILPQTAQITRMTWDAFFLKVLWKSNRKGEL